MDEPAHLATGLVFVLALLTLARSRRAPLSFLAAAVVASVAIDLDHLPGLLGWHGLTQGTPRPYTHSLATPRGPDRGGCVARRSRQADRFRCGFRGVRAPVPRPLHRPRAGARMAAVRRGGETPVPGIRRRSDPHRSRGHRRNGSAALVVASAGPRRVSPRCSRASCRVCWRRPSRRGSPLRRPAATASQTAFGAYIPRADQHPGLISSFAKRVGREPAILSSYRRWPTPLIVRARAARRSGDAAPLPLVTWEPWTLSGRGFSLRRDRQRPLRRLRAARGATRPRAGGTRSCSASPTR